MPSAAELFALAKQAAAASGEKRIEPWPELMWMVGGIAIGILVGIGGLLLLSWLAFQGFFGSWMR